MLYKNYLNSQEYRAKCQNSACSSLNLSLPIRVEVPKVSMQRLSCLETNSAALSPTLKINSSVNNMTSLQNENKMIDYRYTPVNNSVMFKTDSYLNQSSPLSQRFKQQDDLNGIYQQNCVPQYNNDTIINPLQYYGGQSLSRASALSKAVVVANIKRHSSNRINNTNINNSYEYQQQQQVWRGSSPGHIVFDQV